MEHLLNCHGEWIMLLSLLSSLPFIGVWFRSKLPVAKQPEPDEEGYEEFFHGTGI